MKKNVVWWPAIVNESHVDKYGGYNYFQYSKNTWEYWCKRNDCLFVPFTEPIEEDLVKYRVNWQKALFVFDELEIVLETIRKQYYLLSMENHLSLYQIIYFDVL